MTEISKSLFIEEYEMVSEEYEFASEEYEYGYLSGNDPEFQDVLLMEEILQQFICVKWHCMSLDPCAYRVSRRPLDQ